MVYWRHRHLAYKIGFCGLVFSLLVYVVGFALPYWAVLRLDAIGRMDTTVGLWQSCIYPSLTCASNVHAHNPPWINASRAMCTLTLLIFTGVLWSGCYRNVFNYGQKIANLLVVISNASLSWVVSVVGFVGCVIFATEFHRIYIHSKDLGHLSWAFAIVCSALSLAGICACIMFIFNRSRYHHARAARTLRAGRNGSPVVVQFPAELGNDNLHIPYFGEISRDQLVLGAAPLQPPSYNMVTGNNSYSRPPEDLSEAPPLYEDIGKDAVLSPEVVAQLERGDKECGATAAKSCE